MSKKRVAISLSEENVEWIDANYNNRSAFFDDLVTDYRRGTSHAENVVARHRKQELDVKAASLKAQLEAVEEQRNVIESTVETKEQRREEVVEKAVAELDIDPSVGFDHEAARTWAEKAEMEVSEFWSAYTEAYHE